MSSGTQTIFSPRAVARANSLAPFSDAELEALQDALHRFLARFEGERAPSDSRTQLDVNDQQE